MSGLDTRNGGFNGSTYAAKLRPWLPIPAKQIKNAFYNLKINLAPGV